MNIGKTQGNKQAQNIHAQLDVIRTKCNSYQIAVQRGHYQDSYLYSVYSHYIHYAKEELRKLSLPWYARALFLFLQILSFVLRIGRINTTAFVNASFYSTDKQDCLPKQEVQQLTSSLENSYPNYAIAFRCVNHTEHKELMEHLSMQQFQSIPYRLIYRHYPDNIPKKKQAKKVETDITLLENSSYKQEEIYYLSETELLRIQELYNKLYIQKYSSFNPQYTASFFQQLITQKSVQLVVLRQNNQIDGVIGYREGKRSLYPLLLGYDTDKKGVPLYRMLQAILFQKAKKTGKSIHQGAGASFYKKQRGGIPEWEYLFVRYKHLPIWRRLPWELLKYVTHAVGTKIVQKTEPN